VGATSIVHDFTPKPLATQFAQRGLELIEELKSLIPVSRAAGLARRPSLLICVG
jgi:hypothetical protein